MRREKTLSNMKFIVCVIEIIQIILNSHAESSQAINILQQKQLCCIIQINTPNQKPTWLWKNPANLKMYLNVFLYFLLNMGVSHLPCQFSGVFKPKHETTSTPACSAARCAAVKMSSSSSAPEADWQVGRSGERLALDPCYVSLLPSNSKKRCA